MLAKRSTQPGEGSFLLERGRAGQFEIGMTVDEVVKLADGGEPGVHIADLDLTFAIGETASFTDEARVIYGLRSLSSEASATIGRALD